MDRTAARVSVENGYATLPGLPLGKTVTVHITALNDAGESALTRAYFPGRAGSPRDGGVLSFHLAF